MRIIVNYFIYLFLILFIYSDLPKYNVDSINYANKEDYNFILDIPKINLNVMVYNYNDKRNNVNKGIYLVNNYDFNSLKYSLILASHSGNSNISYFKHLHLLSIGDIIKIKFNNNYYIYNISDIYYIRKNGKFKYSNDDKTIYLITCDKKNKKKQLIIKGNLVNITKKSNF